MQKLTINRKVEITICLPSADLGDAAQIIIETTDTTTNTTPTPRQAIDLFGAISAVANTKEIARNSKSTGIANIESHISSPWGLFSTTNFRISCKDNNIRGNSHAPFPVKMRFILSNNILPPIRLFNFQANKLLSIFWLLFTVSRQTEKR